MHRCVDVRPVGYSRASWDLLREAPVEGEHEHQQKRHRTYVPGAALVVQLDVHTV